MIITGLKMNVWYEYSTYYCKTVVQINHNLRVNYCSIILLNAVCVKYRSDVRPYIGPSVCPIGHTPRGVVLKKKWGTPETRLRQFRPTYMYMLYLNYLTLPFSK